MKRNLAVSRREASQMLLALGLSALSPALYARPEWPGQPIRLVLGWPPGGGADVMARIVSQALNERISQPVLIENRSGASGNIATTQVVRAPPDGYTFLLGPSTQVTANPFLFNMDSSAVNSLEPFAALGRFQLYLILRKDFPAQNLKELIAHAQANPRKVTYASAGPGSPPHLVAEMFLKQADVTALHVPYRGSAAALQAVLAGETDFAIDPGISFPHVHAGNLKLLAITSKERSAAFPNVPTMIEAGLSAMDFDTWICLWAPRQTPPEILKRFSNELREVLGTESVKAQFSKLGGEARYMDGADISQTLHREADAFSTLIKELNLNLA
ncbi:tripartite tricarboxylate transporter substrate binding protein [Bordetella sp. BOR01]|uniref:tripartite tricarboxylate transporter substrate binding protein n=1 Tax=Bordetella sp. BOR01 TaxID=2854779 RepID=UPI001C484156|nr:tripartite tricarboxylate transporter substrate binding protein [Bordetella sp. BOR01]MBV7485550.1 tripartite tricarboxylate transporter substrate binding protein [Bordetella sp. BOR01]